MNTPLKMFLIAKQILLVNNKWNDENSIENKYSQVGE